MTQIFMELGWGAKPFAEQFPELEGKLTTHLDKMNFAITLLTVNGILTTSERDKARNRFKKYLKEELRKAKP
jgi:hypothetical protein